MNRLGKTLSDNLLGILIAIGVVFITYCVFVGVSDMWLGQYILYAIFIVASYDRSRHNKALEEKLKK